MECARLVSIRATSRFEGGPLDYVPLKHEQAAQHRDCGGLVAQTEDIAKCFKCGDDVLDDAIEHPPCDGHKRVIR